MYATPTDHGMYGGGTDPRNVDRLKQLSGIHLPHAI